jgi:hypothetical protein
MIILLVLGGHFPLSPHYERVSLRWTHMYWRGGGMIVNLVDETTRAEALAVPSAETGRAPPWRERSRRDSSLGGR